MNLALALLALWPQLAPSEAGRVEGSKVERDDDAAAALARSLQKLRERVSKSVVAIEVERESDPDGRAAGANRDYYTRPKGPASGVIYEEGGFILTSHFNVSGDLKKNGLKVTLWNGKECAAELVGLDEQRDIALLKIEEKGLPILPKADLATIGQGTLVALVGRSPDKEVATLNVGIISAMNRMNKAAVQTDAEMNYGNAGGALVTLKGELIGVGCNVKPGNVWGQSGGIGFACKATEIDRLLERLKKGEKITAAKVPFLGVRPGEGDPNVEGLQVVEVIAGSPAEKAGIKKDDVIVEFGGKKVTDFESLRELIADRKIGDEVALKVKRPKNKDKKEYDDKEFKVKLEGRPEQQ